MRRFYGKTYAFKDLARGQYEFTGTAKVHGTHLGVFVDGVMVSARVEQGKEKHGPGMCKALLDWVIHDIFTEEADVVEASGLTKKDVSSAIAARLRAMSK